MNAFNEQILPIPWFNYGPLYHFPADSDVTAGKIIALGPMTVSVTVLYFPVTYILADVLTEVYGYAQARRAIWCSGRTGLLVGEPLPPAPSFQNNEAYQNVLGQLPRILLGGWIAVWAGAMINNYVLARMKVGMAGKHLWLRTITSTIFGEGVNTILFYLIALYGFIPSSLLWTSILSATALKVGIEALFTPITYYVVKKLKKAENEDHYDQKTDFNPFKFSAK